MADDFKIYLDSEIKILKDQELELKKEYDKLFEKLTIYEEKIRACEIVALELRKILDGMESRKKKDQ